MSKSRTPNPASPEQLKKRLRKRISKEAKNIRNYDRAMEIFNGEKKKP